ncbi:hypothetical protein P691DRAFT_793758 [Macrolepiota fuliginosa MF-IS2]|uniref:Uncharacterized protein n=1 Tax=Macrolepiota fuliginosa MF-IS2 TaxID=1400762 RepID=A0A9P6BW83_9AGAR|nr:hypothetical protein P691DRAFT_793758 [Macrolepiota fuliginosa MF-IS2]
MPASCLQPTQRACLFAVAFNLWSPNLYRYYKEQMDKIFAHAGHPKSIFACTSTNLPPNACMVPHFLALGNFDPAQGGHLVLHNLRLVIEFPPSSTILLPSATLEHSNTPVHAHEARASITHYSSGGIFRHADNSFRTEVAFEEQDPEGFAEMMRQKGDRWKKGLALFSTLDKLKYYKAGSGPPHPLEDGEILE